jgi:hypothetical protein
MARAGRCRQIQRLRQRDEADAEVLQFLESYQQVRQRSAPTIQSPHQHYVDLAAARRLQQLLPQLPFGCTATDLFHLEGDGPTPPGGVFP